MEMERSVRKLVIFGYIFRNISILMIDFISCSSREMVIIIWMVISYVVIIESQGVNDIEIEIMVEVFYSNNLCIYSGNVRVVQRVRDGNY